MEYSIRQVFSPLNDMNQKEEQHLTARTSSHWGLNLEGNDALPCPNLCFVGFHLRMKNTVCCPPNTCLEIFQKKQESASQ